ncbi:MAG TPA: SPFH domain-containing protein [Gemmatimonadaceae bacterium]|jgi:regulator of protease activity HflC (stomatin/prohibitin superfamily)
MYREKPYAALNGFVMLLTLITVAVLSFLVILRAAAPPGQMGVLVTALVVLLVALFCLGGLFIVNPNEAKALVLFGSYKGTLKRDGFFWANPFLVKRRVSLRVRNFETAKLKVNDIHANPIEIGAIVVWKVVETAEALFEVDSYEKYVTVQTESALRATASQFAYDAHQAGEESLSTHAAEVSKHLQAAVQERLARAGVEVLEARISHLAYAQEIAAAMLQRQQASAIIAARYKIVEGAVGMVENALELLAKKNIVQLDDERKATMVSNLLVVLCSERSTQPVVNTGSLYT